uniref:Uncharacterized protein n=1 Tax=Sphaerodactylus townsendi TaxID=933632 RepID=A0ACB8GDC7_9SAUR
MRTQGRVQQKREQEPHGRENREGLETVATTTGVSVAEAPLHQTQPPEPSLGGAWLNQGHLNWEPHAWAELQTAAPVGRPEPVTRGSGVGSEEIDPGAAEATILLVRSIRPGCEGGAPQDTLVTRMKAEHYKLYRRPLKHQRSAVEHTASGNFTIFAIFTIQHHCYLSGLFKNQLIRDGDTWARIGTFEIREERPVAVVLQPLRYLPITAIVFISFLFLIPYALWTYRSIQESSLGGGSPRFEFSCSELNNDCNLVTISDHRRAQGHRSGPVPNSTTCQSDST